MPVNIENVTSDVAITDGTMPLTEAQIEQIVVLVLRRLDEAKREERRAREATMLRSQVAPPAYGDDRGEPCS